jgi:hypothetical protein
MAMIFFVKVVLALCFIYLLKRIFFRNEAGTLSLPPGPKGLPILGNVKDLPISGKPEFEHWIKHKDRYGPISSVTALGLTMIIIHDKSMALELLEKRGVRHSGRPRTKFAMDM